MKNIFDYITENKLYSIIDTIINESSKFIDFLNSSESNKIFTYYYDKSGWDIKDIERSEFEHAYEYAFKETADSLKENKEDYMEDYKTKADFFNVFWDNFIWNGEQKIRDRKTSDAFVDIVKRLGNELFEELWNSAKCRKLS